MGRFTAVRLSRLPDMPDPSSGLLELSQGLERRLGRFQGAGIRHKLLGTQQGRQGHGLGRRLTRTQQRLRLNAFALRYKPSAEITGLFALGSS